MFKTREEVGTSTAIYNEEQRSSVRLSSFTTVQSPKPDMRQSYSGELSSASDTLPAAPSQHFPGQPAISEPPLMPAPASVVALKPFFPYGGAAAAAGSEQKAMKKKKQSEHSKH